MQATITLTITTGKLAGKTYTFDQRTNFILGRSDDCDLSIPDEFYRRVSRYHCVLDINPPEIKIKDLGSLNGTYINKHKIGQRESNQAAKDTISSELPEYELKDGDEITLGDMVLRVTIENNVKVNSHDQNDQVALPKPNNYQPKLKPNNTETAKISNVAKTLIKLANEDNKNLALLCNYELIKLIGKNSFGEVYLVQHNQTRATAALKIMIPSVVEEESRIKKFAQEIENLQTLKHPHIVDILGYGYGEKVFFILMEYHKLGNVCNLMKQLGGKIPVPMALGIILQVLDGLNYAHSQEVPYIKLANGNVNKGKGLLHRNLKPDNILLSTINRKLVAKVSDHGLAKSFYIAGLSGQAVTKIKKDGEPLFIPRQQVLKFQECKPDVDVWASAACLYNMLTGCLPRDFGNEPWLDVLQNDPVPIRQRDDSIPTRLAEVIDLALVEKPHIHFQSAAAFKQALVESIT
ncbi:MAG: FHA domain-containing protein [Nostocales cyanobacterium]|nr:MAG: FHA domain-containing protein [Nostocales cyanobacterium]TAF12808.1 MAG: FHA domain-containing protein [Nostocales cyanobacterium]